FVALLIASGAPLDAVALCLKTKQTVEARLLKPLGGPPVTAPVRDKKVAWSASVKSTMLRAFCVNVPVCGRLSPSPARWFAAGDLSAQPSTSPPVSVIVAASAASYQPIRPGSPAGSQPPARRGRRPVPRVTSMFFSHEKTRLEKAGREKGAKGRCMN